MRRILTARYRPEPDSAGPSWLTVLGHAKDSLWSLDLFRCESAVLRTHWVLVVMDHYTRRIVGFGVHRGVVDGVALCRMFNRATRGHTPPTYVSSDQDPLYRFGQWQRNLRILDVQEIKTVPYVPLSHPVRCVNPSVSRGALIFVEQSAESIAANHGQRAPVGLICSGRPPVRRREVQASVSPMPVVMITEHRQHALEVTAIKKQEPVEAFRTNGPDKSFGDPVRRGTSIGVRTIRIPAPWNTSSKRRVNFRS